jgi:DNA polymerase III epsilon subunit-like protein
MTSHPTSRLKDVERSGQSRSGFAVVDVETTGFSPETERIIEVGVVVLDDAGVEVGSFCTLLDPGCDPGPTHIHGITPQMIEGSPPFGSVHSFLADLLSGRVVVGHNVDGFDLDFLRAECHRAGGQGLVPGPVTTIDTLSVAQAHLGLRGRAKLVDCCTHFGLSWNDHHSALGDARVTAALFRSMWAKLGGGTLEIGRLLAAARMSAWPGASDLTTAVRGRADTAIRAAS